ncbi:MAG TPA: 16S rRNA (cytosine(1402)-N(4))-methyltransferase RsmH [Terriglobia bacterium]|nr:16S rRNA (cytosine(1402)-N(4))-methyltransferase RsmH [Terriglobia bacterium]
MYGHRAVLLDETLDYLDPQPGRRYIDATFGAGGHTQALLERTEPSGRVLALDVDEAALGKGLSLKQAFGDRLTLVKANFRDIFPIAEEHGFLDVDGILADIGVSSMMLDDPDRGFSFMREGALDMRMDRSQPLTAADIVNTYGEKEIADILFKYGEERRSRPIARSIVRSRPLSSTLDLSRAVERVLGGPRFGRIHPATRTFQGLRIAVNAELESLELFLKSAPRCLRPGGRVAVITFHSLEDRIVKHTFRAGLVPGKPITKKVVTAGDAEVSSNPRARSAKLRVWEKSHVD